MVLRPKPLRFRWRRKRRSSFSVEAETVFSEILDDETNRVPSICFLLQRRVPPVLSVFLSVFLSVWTICRCFFICFFISFLSVFLSLFYLFFYQVGVKNSDLSGYPKITGFSQIVQNSPFVVDDERQFYPIG